MKFQGLYLFIFASLSLADISNPDPSQFPDWSKVGKFTPEILHSVNRMSGATVSPDKTKLVHAQRRFNQTANDSGTNLRITDISSGKASDLTPFSLDQGDSSPVWITNNLVGFSAVRGSPALNLFTVSTADGSVKQVTNYTNDISGVVYSPAAKKIAFIASVYQGMGVEESAKEYERLAEIPYSGVVFDKLFIRHWDTWITKQRAQLFTVDANVVDGSLTVSGTPVNLIAKYTGEWGLEPDTYSFSPDGKSVLFSAKIQGREEAWQTQGGIFTVPADGSAAPVMHNSDFMGAASSPVYSPDGKSIAWLQMATRGYESDQNQILLLDIASQQRRRLIASWDRSPDSIEFSADGSKLFLQVPYEIDEAVFSLTIADEKLTRLSGKGTVSSFQELGPDSMLVTMNTFQFPDAAFILNTTGNMQLTKVTSENDAILGGLWMSDVDTFWFTGALDQQVEGLVLYPYGFDPSKKYPTAFVIHGGPQSSWNNGWSYRWNMNAFANQGYVVVIINFHGGSAYGQNFTDSITRNWGSYPFEDLMKGLDFYLAKTTYSDCDNVVALGASYGGYMINWVNGNTDRFRCLVNHDGVFSLVSMGYATEELWFNEHDMGIPWVPADRASMEQWNPERLVANWKTPTLIVHSSLDFRVPLTEGISTFTALQRRGIASRLLYFPDESHWVLNPMNSLKWHDEVFKWIGSYSNTTVWQLAINSHIQPQETNVFSTMPDSKGSKHSSKLLDTGPEKNPEENGQKLNVLEIKQEKNEKTDKEATVTATASNKNNVSGSSGAGSTLDIPSSTASVTENKHSAIKRVEKHKLKVQTPLFAPYSKPNSKKKLNKPTGNVAQTQIKKEDTDFNEINDIEIEDGEVIEYEEDSIISAADNVTQINSDEIAIDDNNNDPSDHEMLNTQEVNSMNEYFAEKNGQEWIDQIAKDAETLDSVKTCFKNLVENIPLSMDNKVKVDMLMTLAKETKNKMIAILNGKSTINTQDKSIQVKPLLLTKKYRKTMPKEQGKSAPNDYEKLEPM
ncbi:hypothetical protein BB559_005392, partial [Furculomyces boomerangus]